MKLISESINDIEFITESNDSSRVYKIKGPFLQGNIKNRNGRVYPMEILDKEVQRYNEQFIKESRSFGELGHPDGPTVNLDRVSHMITSLKRDGNNYIGEAKIMETPMGKIVKNLLDEGAKLGVSSRGMGSLVEKGGTKYVGKDFYLATAADIVADPSAPQAFVEGIYEGKEWVWDNGLLKEVEVQQIQEDLERSIRSRNAKAQALAFAQFLKKL